MKTVKGVRISLSKMCQLWHMDYFELKTIKTQQIQENFYLSCNYLKGDLVQEENYHRK